MDCGETSAVVAACNLRSTRNDNCDFYTRLLMILFIDVFHLFSSANKFYSGINYLMSLEYTIIVDVMF